MKMLLVVLNVNGYTLNLIKSKKDVIGVTGYTKDDEENRCIMNDDFKQYLNTCGIYRFDLDDNGEVLIRDNKPVINGTVSNINDVNVFDPNTDNHGRAATWFVNHEVSLVLRIVEHVNISYHLVLK